MKRVHCDWCGSAAEMRAPNSSVIGGWESPVGWEVLRKRDLCPDCVKRILGEDEAPAPVCVGPFR